MNKKYLFALSALATTAAITVPVMQAEAAAFKDVKAGSETEKAIEALSKKGIISGYQDGTFKPGKEITRAQAAKILAIALKLDTDAYIEKTYADVPETHANAPYIYAIAKAGIVDPNAEKFNPNKSVTRSQMAKMLTIGFNLQPGKTPPFTDVKTEDSKKYVGSLSAYGITTGTSPTTFGAANAVTRGQMAQFIYRAINNTADARATITNAQFNEKYIHGALNDYYSDGSIQLIYENRYGTLSWIEVNALKPGTSHFYVGGHTGEGANDYTTPIRYYRADVALVDGKLKLTVTELDEPLVEPSTRYLNVDVADVKLTYANGTPVEASRYKLGTDQGREVVYISGESADMFIEETLVDGTKHTTALKYIVTEPRSMIVSGLYTSGQFVMTKEQIAEKFYIQDLASIEVKPFVDGWGKERPQAVKAELINGEIHGTVIGEGINMISYTTENGEKSEFMLTVDSFENGYIMH